MKRFLEMMIAMLSISPLSFLIIEAFAENEGVLTLHATPNNEEGYVQLNWEMKDKSEPYTYRIFQKGEGKEEYQSIPAKETAKVLNVYPEVEPKITYTTWNGENKTLPKSASAEMWMESPNEEHPKGYGMGLIDVDPVSLSDFNENPEKYLKDENGKWKYDVVFFGLWDNNNNQDISVYAKDLVIDFIEEGKGLLLGHDTMHGSPNHNMVFKHFSDYTNVKLYEDINIAPFVGSTTVEIVKNGLLTTYPWDIGELGDELNVPNTHTTRQIALGDIWLKFKYFEENAKEYKWYGEEKSDPETNTGTNNFYLTTWNNTAMIQTGHSNGEATPDEQKILANTLFYLSQLTNDTRWQDRSANDLAEPDVPIIESVEYDKNTGEINIEFVAVQDNGTDYMYFVEATGQNTGNKYTSNEVTVTVTSGLKGYSIVADKNPDTIPDKEIDTTNNVFTLTKNFDEDFYVHVGAVDYNGNMSVAHYKVDITPPDLSLTKEPNDWTNGSVKIKANASDGQDEIVFIGLNASDNLVSDEDIGLWRDGTLDIRNNKMVLTPPLDEYRGGIFIPSSIFKKDKNYLLMFDMTKLEGEIPVIGGHLHLASESEVYIDGKRVYRSKQDDGEPNDWSSGVYYPNDTKKHRVIVKFTTDRMDTTDNRNVYIQPNRLVYNDYYKIQFENVLLIEGDEFVVGEKDLEFHTEQNGIYEFVVRDYAGNETKKSIEVDNIDKTPPTIDITPNTIEKTHENVTLTVNAEDDESGVKRIMYIGENMIKNGDFSEGYEHWMNSSSKEGTFELTEENTMLLQSPVNRNKMKQDDAFLGSAVGAIYYAEVTARGNGVLNVRYGIKDKDGDPQDNRTSVTNEKDFEIYKFLIERFEWSNDQLVVEKVGKEGWLEIKEIKVFEQQDITNTKRLEVARNGTYTFIVEDNAGNITATSYTVTNIDKSFSFEIPEIKSFEDVYLDEKVQKVTTDLTPVIIKDWREDTNTWRLDVSASPLKLKNSSFELPKGTFSLKRIKNIEKTNGNEELPILKHDKTKVIDDGKITLVQSDNSRGEHVLNFEENALKITVNPSIAKRGRYSSVITWEVINAP